MDTKNLLKDSKAYYEDNDYYEIFSIAEDGENKVGAYLEEICKDKIVLDAGCGTGKFLNILEECEKAGNPDIVYEFCSTSKITFPGAGVAAMASSEANIADIKSKLKWQTIGPDKINQLRHVRYFKDINGMKDYMKKHAAIIRPKFEAVLETLEKELGELGIASWSKPVGGYFISFNAEKGCAKAIVAKCKEAGLVLTGAGAAYPYGNDPEDSNIRIAPTLPPIEELKVATDLFVTCTKLVTVEKFLSEME